MERAKMTNKAKTSAMLYPKLDDCQIEIGRYPLSAEQKRYWQQARLNAQNLAPNADSAESPDPSSNRL